MYIRLRHGRTYLCFRYNCRPYIIPQLLREQRFHATAPRRGGAVPAPSVAAATAAAVVDPTAR